MNELIRETLTNLNGKIQLDFHSDSGHGWLSVPYCLLTDYGVDGDISKYSYRKGQTVYLEEDCDANKLLSKLRESGIEFELNEIITDRKSFIRNYQSYYQG